MLRYIDLFSGIGGIRLGLEQALKKLSIPYRCVLSSEIDKKACETYMLNFNEDSFLNVKDVVDVKNIDFVLAGFPCQPFSYAGEKRGFEDTRGTLFFEVERILEESKPKGFLLENVRGLVTHDHGRTLKTILKRLTKLGYNVEYYILNSSDFGVPQNRVRIYILGLLEHKMPMLNITSSFGAADSHRFKQEFKNQSSVLVKNILEFHVDDKYYCTKKFTKKLSNVVSGDFKKLHGARMIDYRGGNSIRSWELGLRGPCSKKEIIFMNSLVANRRLKKFGVNQDGKKLTLAQIKTFYRDEDIDSVISSLMHKGYLQKNSEGKFNPKAGNMSFEIFKFLDPESVSITLVTSDAHRIGVVGKDEKPRRITPRECARIQGFPDSFKLHPCDTDAYRQLGNTVSVPVVEKILFEFFKASQKIFADDSIFHSEKIALPSGPYPQQITL